MADDPFFQDLETQPALQELLAMQELIFVLLGHANFAAVRAQQFAREAGCAEQEVKRNIQMAVEDAITVDMKTLLENLERVREGVERAARGVAGRGQRAEDGYRWENKRKALLSIEQVRREREEERGRRRMLSRSQSLVGLRELEGAWTMRDKGMAPRTGVAAAA